MSTSFIPPTREEIIMELKRQYVEEKYYEEALQIVPRRMETNECSLKEAVEFIVYWVHRVNN